MENITAPTDIIFVIIKYIISLLRQVCYMDGAALGSNQELAWGKPSQLQVA